MTTLILVRHGETDWNVEGRYQGQSDVPLNDRGRRQALEVCEKIAPFDPCSIYSSDLNRARATAELLSASLRLPLYLDPRLREIHLGQWEGMLFSDIQARYSMQLKERNEDPARVGAPGGENVAQVRQRVIRVIAELQVKIPEKSVVVVSHGLPLAILIAAHQHRPISDVYDLIPGNITPYVITSTLNLED